MNGELQVRVRVLEAWEDVVMQLPAPTPIATVKRHALDAVRVTEAADEFLVKFRGAAISDESRSLADVGVPADGALIVMRRARVAVR